MTKLPEGYTLVPAVTVTKSEPPVPDVCGLQKPGYGIMSKAVAQDNDWCDDLSKIISEGNYDTASGRAALPVSWAAYHSRRREQAATPDDSKSVAMIRHSMNVVKKAVTIVNPGQTQVIACDQPLFKIAKQIQWMWPEEYEEESFVMMLGCLHIKMALLKACGDLLDGSGWTSAIMQAQIATAGTSNSFLKAVHGKKADRAHQITACALYKLRQLGGLAFSLMSSQNVTPHRLMNGANGEKLSAQFHFWQLVISTDLDVLAWD